MKKINYANRKACRDCPLRSRCTGNQFRTVSRLENEAVLDRMQARLAKRPDILDQRRETVEHPFGSIKQWMNQGAFLMRGLEKVRAEFSLTALAYNLRRVLNLVGFHRADGRGAGVTPCRTVSSLVLPVREVQEGDPRPHVSPGSEGADAPLGIAAIGGTAVRPKMSRQAARHRFPHGLLDFCTNRDLPKL